MTAALAILKRAWPYLLGVLLFAGALFLAYGHGKQTEADRLSLLHTQVELEREQAHSAALVELHEKSAANLAAAQAIARANLAAKLDLQNFFTGLDNRVSDYVETNSFVRDCGLDAIGLRIWNDANAGRDSGPAQPGGAGTSDGALP